MVDQPSRSSRRWLHAWSVHTVRISPFWTIWVIFDVWVMVDDETGASFGIVVRPLGQVVCRGRPAMRNAGLGRDRARDRGNLLTCAARRWCHDDRRPNEHGSAHGFHSTCVKTHRRYHREGVLRSWRYYAMAAACRTRLRLSGEVRGMVALMHSANKRAKPHSEMCSAISWINCTRSSYVRCTYDSVDL